MSDTVTRIPPGSPLRRPGVSSWDWAEHRRMQPIAAAGLAAAVSGTIWLAIGALVAWVLPW